MKRFERSNGLDTALYKNYLFTTGIIVFNDLLHTLHSSLCHDVIPNQHIVIHNSLYMDTRYADRGHTPYNNFIVNFV